MIRYENPHKRYVTVNARHEIGGRIIPLSFAEEDGDPVEIDRVLDIRQAASLKAGGNGVRYICSIDGKEVRLFHDRDDWFIEI